MRSRRAIVASYGVPEPDRDTGSRRVLDLVQLLQAAGWTISFVALNGIIRQHYATELQQRGVPVYGERAGAPLGSSAPLEDALAAGPCDLCVLAFWPVAERLIPVVRELSPDTRVVVDSIDLHLLRDARRLFQQSHGGATGVLDAEYGSQLTGELNTYAAADAVLTVSDKETNFINDLTGQRDLAYTVGLIEDQPRSRKLFRRRSGILTVGNYAHLPNLDALEYLCHDILPRLDAAILAEHPVYVLGAGLDDAAERFANTPWVRLVGWVPSMRPYLERARVAVVPLQYGAGAKGKVIEALMAGTPTVATPIGVEGLGLVDGEHLLVADGAQSFADAMTSVLTNEKQWTSLARQGRKQAAALHGRARVAEQFLAVVDRVLAGSPKPAILPVPDPAHYQGRLHYQDVQRISARLHRTVAAAVPAEATLAVVTGGEEWLLEFGKQSVMRFPDPEEPARVAGRPTGEVAIEVLEGVREAGADFLVVPARASWWFERFQALRTYLDDRYRVVTVLPGTCTIYELRPVVAKRGDTEPEAADSGSASAPEAEEEPYDTSSVRLIAFYLPQFHPIPENDEWWGPGFTEWTNVVKAQPAFPGHDQPMQPAELGYYDLRDPVTRAAQADLARAHGIHAFCYYHYWFNGKRLLERPFDEVLASGEPDFPFCLCWANEPWSRRWDGSSEDVLQPQHYSAADDAAHMAWLLPALKDPRAVTIDGQPLFLVYQARALPDPERTAKLWRRMVGDAGLPGLYLVAVETGWDAGWDPTQAGFDAKVLFQPQFSILRTAPRTEIPGRDDLQVYDYDTAWPILADPEPVDYLRYDTVFPHWDNSARAGDRAVVVSGSTPASYEAWLALAVRRAARRAPDRQLVFINAWNEWAEGCQLEPGARHGREYLEATRRAVGHPPGVATGKRSTSDPSQQEAGDEGGSPAFDLAPVKWDFPQQDAGSLTPEETAETLAGFEERTRRWASSHAEPARSGDPKISVEVPVTSGRWLMPCIESVLNQSSAHWRLYLLWHAGDELSRRVLQIVEAVNHPQITVHFKDQGGVVEARQRLSATSAEDHIFPMDQDDMLHPRAVEAMLQAAAEKPWFAVMRAQRRIVDETGDFTTAEEPAPLGQRRYQHGMVKDLHNCDLPYVVSRRAYDQTEGWEGFEDLEPAGQHGDLHLKLEEQGSIELLDLPLYYHRENGHRGDQRSSSAGGHETWRRLADKTIDRVGLPIRRVNDEAPFTYERLITPRPDISMMDVVIAFYASDEQELPYCNSRVLASKQFEFVKLSEVLTFDQTIRAELFPCDRIELTCVLLTSFESTLTIAVTDPESQGLVAEGRAELRYAEGPGLLTVKVAMDQKSAPVAPVLDCAISCTPTGTADDSFNLVLQENDVGERVAAMRMFRHTPGFSRRMLERCLRSVRACGVSDEAIHVVEKKQSAAANRNDGFARTTRPYVCYVDDDVEITDERTFTKLLCAMAETDAAVIGPRLITDVGVIYCADGYFDERLHPKPRGLGEEVGSAYRYTKEVPWLPSTLFICRSEAIKAVGGFDEGYAGSQMEDVDFCLKLRQRDLKCVYDGSVDVVHYNYQRNDRFAENFERFAGRWRQHGRLFESPQTVMAGSATNTAEND